MSLEIAIITSGDYILSPIELTLGPCSTTACMILTKPVLSSFNTVYPTSIHVRMNKYEGKKDGPTSVGYDVFIAKNALSNTELSLVVLYVMVPFVRVSLSAQKEAMITPSVGKNLGRYMLLIAVSSRVSSPLLLTCTRNCKVQ